VRECLNTQKIIIVYISLEEHKNMAYSDW